MAHKGKSGKSCVCWTSLFPRPTCYWNFPSEEENLSTHAQNPFERHFSWQSLPLLCTSSILTQCLALCTMQYAPPPLLTSSHHECATMHIYYYLTWSAPAQCVTLHFYFSSQNGNWPSTTHFTPLTLFTCTEKQSTANLPAISKIFKNKELTKMALEPKTCLQIETYFITLHRT